MRVVKIKKEDWSELAEKAHLIVFNEIKKPEMDRIDFALMVETEGGIPMQYATCQERDRDTIYFQYGGSFPDTKGTTKSLRCMQEILKWTEQAGYRYVAFLVENVNQAMLKLAMHTGFIIVGIRNFRGMILLEHVREFKDG